MPKVPRDLTGIELVRLLNREGFRVVRQTGSHIRLESSQTGNAGFAITIPNHSPIKIGTLNAILAEVSGHLGKTKAQLINYWFQS